MTGPSRLVLLGHPVAHSLSPVIQNAALDAAGIPLRYETVDVKSDELRSVLASLRAERAAGNVTIPHKSAAARLMGRLSPVAARVGGVNTFFTDEEGETAGDNTDVAGFTALVRLMLGEIPRGAHFAIIGAGAGAAAALAAIESWEGCAATVYARNSERARSLTARFGDVTRGESLEHGAMLHGDIVVNATPIGLADEQQPVSLDAIPRNAVVLDLAYRRDETAWVRAARASGRIASDGLPMLVEQGAAAFEIWFGVPADREAMWRAVKEATGRF